jgi:hypothetical protein
VADEDVRGVKDSELRPLRTGTLVDISDSTGPMKDKVCVLPPLPYIYIYIYIYLIYLFPQKAVK